MYFPGQNRRAWRPPKRRTTDRGGIDQTASVANSRALAQYQAVLASTLDPVIIIDAWGIIQTVSNSVHRVFGYSPDELVGRNVTVLMPEPHRSRHDSHMSRYRRTGKTSIIGVPQELEAVRKDGTRIPVEISVSRSEVPGETGPLFTGIVRDLTERRKAEQEFRLLHTLTVGISEARSLVEALIATLRDICTVTGWDYGEVWLRGRGGLGKPEASWMRPGTGLERKGFGGVDGSAAHRRSRFWCPDRELWVTDLANPPAGADCLRKGDRAGMGAAAVIPIRCDDAPEAVLVFFISKPKADAQRMLTLAAAAASPLGNLMRRKRAEDELERHHAKLEELVAERTKELQHSHEQLRVADRLAAIGTLAAGLGHDMNNVLLPVSCRIDALEKTKLPARVREELAEVRRSVRYLQQLSDGLHLLALDPDAAEATLATTGLEEWWQQVGVLMRRAVPKGAKLEVSLAEGLPAVRVAPHRLTQAVLNLVVNAGEALGKRGLVRLAAEADHERDAVRITVIDNGCGMTPEVMRRAMDPFFTTKKRGLGTGLGLSLVRSVAQSTGGSVQMDSKPGKGTSVTLTLPVDHGALLAREPGRPAPGAVVSLGDTRESTYVAALLASAGFNAEHADNVEGRDALLWVTDAKPASTRIADRFLAADGRRRILCFGHCPGGWRRKRIVCVPRTDDATCIREGIAAAVLEIKGGVG